MIQRFCVLGQIARALKVNKGIVQKHWLNKKRKSKPPLNCHQSLLVLIVIKTTLRLLIVDKATV